LDLTLNTTKNFMNHFNKVNDEIYFQEFEKRLNIANNNVNATTPQQVHLSLTENENEMAIMWATKSINIF
jgi:hypothetical protein